MSLFNSLIYKVTYRYFIVVSFIFVVLLWTSNIVFDKLWGYYCRNPVVDLEELYATPKEYDYFPRINLKLLERETLCIEGNQKFITFGSNKDYAYYDTVKIVKPDSAYLVHNKIFINFLDSDKTDTLYLILSYNSNQIFYSSVQINHLNEFVFEPETFRSNEAVHVERYLLKNNDTLINQVLTYFDINKESLCRTSDCGNNSRILKSICDSFNLPCRIIILQRGDSFEAGLEDKLGYPKHAVCEIYSSRYRKWYVIDPLYGIIFLKDMVPQNAAEISHLVLANMVSDIVPDSVLTSRDVTLQNDYYKYYKNIYYTSNLKKGFVKFLIERFYGNYLYFQYHSTHKMLNYMDGRMYCALKTLMYLMITVIYVFVILTAIKRRQYFKTNKPEGSK